MKNIPKRKIIRINIVPCNDPKWYTIIALCEDGTLWQKEISQVGNFKWKEIETDTISNL